MKNDDTENLLNDSEVWKATKRSWLVSWMLLASSCSFNATVLMPQAAEIPYRISGCPSFQMPKLPEAPKPPSEEISKLNPNAKDYSEKTIDTLVKALESYRQYEKTKDELMAKAHAQHVKQCAATPL